MGITKLERVMWRIRKANPGVNRPTYHSLRQAIIKEIGTSYWCYNENKKALTILGWITTYNKRRFRLTNKDLEES